jgi:hypothetical protein
METWLACFGNLEMLTDAVATGSCHAAETLQAMAHKI